MSTLLKVENVKSTPFLSVFSNRERLFYFHG